MPHVWGYCHKINTIVATLFVLMLSSNLYTKLVQAKLAVRMASNIPRLLLFDIDGTLTKSIYNTKIGKGSYICEALSTAFDREILKKDVVFSGGTDGSIAEDLLQANGVTCENCENYNSKVHQAISLIPQLINKGIADGRYSWERLPNVNKLLDVLSKRDDVKLALLTGNHHDAAVAKLDNAGVDTSHFRWGRAGSNPHPMFGAFGGSDHPARAELVRIARARYRLHLEAAPGSRPPVEVGDNDMVVIGDSPRDIACAHESRVPCVAVDSGIFGADQLRAADHVLVGGFADVDASVRAIVRTHR